MACGWDDLGVGVNLHRQETKIWMTYLARGEEGQSLNICEEENYLEKSL